MGINISQIITLTFLLGSILAGAAGVMAGLYYKEIDFMMGFDMGLKAFTAAVLGGIGNIPEAVVGGFVLAIPGGHWERLPGLPVGKHLYFCRAHSVARFQTDRNSG